MNQLFQKILPGLTVAAIIAALTTGTALAVFASDLNNLKSVTEGHVQLDAHPRSATDHAVEKAERKNLEKQILKIDEKLDDILLELRKDNRGGPRHNR